VRGSAGQERFAVARRPTDNPLSQADFIPPYVALFSKPPAKKPDPPKSDSRRASGPRPVSAREVAAQAAGRQKPASEGPAREPTGGDISVTGASLIEWSAAPSAIEVAQANPGLCSVLENAALMYASGQAPAARKLLDDGIANDEDTKLSPLAWLALFDLLQRGNDRAAFDQLALQYVVQFERSAPAWEERAAPAGRTLLSKPTAGGYVAVAGRLSGETVASPLEGLRRAIDKHVGQARVDLSQVTDFDDAGARDLAELLGRARKQKLALSLQRPEKLRAAVEAEVAKGKEGGEGTWLLSLELMQWLHEQAAFDDRAVEFAVTFELSPPSWEPPPDAPSAEPQAPREEAEEPTPANRDVQTVAWSGVMTGQSARQLMSLADFAATRNHIALDMAELERIDFVCAGALLNTINRIESQRKSVQIVAASPIIRALLLLIGISPRHFVRKTA
jgi:ABC-type transporter Mla MlaB component